MNGDIFGGKYSEEEIKRIFEINARPTMLRKPNQAFYKKNADEHGPSWADKRELVRFLIHDSNISQSSKLYLEDLEFWVPKYQMRGFKYGTVTAGLTFFCFPIVRKLNFAPRFACSMVPMAYFLNWGYVWGHENWWRRVKEVVVTYEIFVDTRSKFTMK